MGLCVANERDVTERIRPALLLQDGYGEEAIGERPWRCCLTRDRAVKAERMSLRVLIVPALRRLGTLQRLPLPYVP